MTQADSKSRSDPVTLDCEDVLDQNVCVSTQDRQRSIAGEGEHTQRSYTLTTDAITFKEVSKLFTKW